jgi:hypothetical protein
VAACIDSLAQAVCGEYCSAWSCILLALILVHCCCCCCCCCCRREEKLAGAVAGGYSRDAAAVGADAYGGAAKRSGDVLSQGFVKPKKFKT